MINLKNNIKVGGYVIYVFLCLMSTQSAKENIVPKYKHWEHISSFSLKNCPPLEATQSELPAFRFVCDPISDNDFKTYFQLGRIQRGTDKKAHSNLCSGCGLSFFNSLESAIEKYNIIKISSAFKYTHIAEGKINKQDGVCSKPSDKGHYTLHEYEGSDLLKKFTISQPL